jgi:hypothetical protein
MGLFGGKKTTQKTTIPSWLENFAQQNLNYANQLTAPVLAGSAPGAVVPFQSDQLKAFDMARNYASGSSPITANALGYDRLQALTDAKPRTLSDFGGIPQQASAPQIAGTKSVSAQKFTDADINAYMNPYLQNVVDSSMTDLGDAYGRNLTASNMQAAASGAFGGGRHGIRDAQVADDYMRNVARTTSGLRNQAYDSAAGLIQGDQNRALQAASANQQASLQRALAQAQMQQQTALSNADRLMQGRLADASNANQADQMRFSAINAMGDAALKAQTSQDQRALQNISLLGQIGDQQLAQQQAIANAPIEALKLRHAMMTGTPYSSETTTKQSGGGLGGLLKLASFIPGVPL